MIALDTNIFIYALENHPEFVSASRRLIAGLDAEPGGGVVSTILLAEIMRKNSRLALEAIESTPKLRVLPVDRLVAIEVASLHRHIHFKLHPFDAIHLATAVVAGAREFWTNDRELAAVKIPKLKIRLLSEWAVQG